VGGLADVGRVRAYFDRRREFADQVAGADVASGYVPPKQ